MAFELKKLSDVCRLINGRAYKKHEMLAEGKYPLLRVGNFFTNRSWFYSDLELNEDKYCDRGDLLYAWSASFGPRIWDGDKVIYHYHIWKIELNEDLVDKGYLYHLLEWDTEQIKEEQGTGTTMIHVTKGAMEKRMLPFPSIPEQKRIVALLDTVFADLEQTRAKTEQNLKNARELFDSSLQQVFSQKGEGWVENKIGKICNFQNGFAFKSKDTVDTSNTQLIRMGNLYQNILSLDRKPAFYPNSFFDEHKRYQLHTGDLIISLTGTVDKEDYGYTVEIPHTERKLLLNQRIAKFINIDSTAINKRFLLRFLRSRGFLDKLYATARGTRQANLSTVTMSEMLISYPTIDEQEKLIRVIDELEKNVFNLENIYKKKLNSIDELKKSILQKAFSGELTAKVE